MVVIKSANLGLRFLLELCALAALGYWGFHMGKGWLARVGLGLGAPLAAALVWGAFVAPLARFSVPEPVRLGLELVVFGSGVAALYTAGRPTLAWAFALTVVVNRSLMFVWGQ